MHMQARTMLHYGLSLLGLVLLLTTAAQAQPGSTGPTPGPPQATPTAVPLDGGAGLLLAGGVAYGLKRMRRRQTQ